MKESIVIHSARVDVCRNVVIRQNLTHIELKAPKNLSQMGKIYFSGFCDFLATKI